MSDDRNGATVPGDENMEDAPAEEQQGDIREAEQGEPFNPSEEDLKQDPA